MLEIKCSVGAGSVTAPSGSGRSLRRRRRKVDEDEGTGNEEDNGNESESDNDLENNDRRRKRKSRKFPSSSASSSTSGSSQTTQWFRYGVDVSKLIGLGEQFQIQKDGTLTINRVELIHAGNYSCHDDQGGSGKGKVIQPYVLQVQSELN